MTNKSEDGISKGIRDLIKIRIEFERMLGIKQLKTELSPNDLIRLGFTPNEAKTLLKRKLVKFTSDEWKQRNQSDGEVTVPSNWYCYLFVGWLKVLLFVGFYGGDCCEG